MKVTILTIGVVIWFMYLSCNNTPRDFENICCVEAGYPIDQGVLSDFDHQMLGVLKGGGNYFLVQTFSMAGARIAMVRQCRNDSIYMQQVLIPNSISFGFPMLMNDDFRAQYLTTKKRITQQDWDIIRESFLSAIDKSAENNQCVETLNAFEYSVEYTIGDKRGMFRGGDSISLKLLTFINEMTGVDGFVIGIDAIKSEIEGF